jgi:hypothetical protein
MAVAERVANQGLANRAVALGRIASAVEARLGVRDRGRARDERRAFATMAPLAFLIPDLERWPRRDRRLLATLMRAKGAPGEREYVLLAQRHRRFISALRAVVAPGR